jgi:RNA polymerase sigma-70 factor, ECF subfamily
VTITQHQYQVRGAGVAEPAVHGVPDESFRQLYQAYGAVVLNYLIRLNGGDRHRAEDILQETFIRAWKHPEARGDNGEWSRPWLFTVARRIAIDQVRAASTRPAELGDVRLEDRPEHDDGYEWLMDRDEVRGALALLPDRFRNVLIEIYFRDHSVAEAAEALGIAPGTVKSRTYYGIRALREALAERGFFQHRPERSKDR